MEIFALVLGFLLVLGVQPVLDSEWGEKHFVASARLAVGMLVVAVSVFCWGIWVLW